MNSSNIIDTAALQQNHVESCEVCIIGGGPAGLFVAAELSQRGIQVCLVEAGPMEPILDDPLVDAEVGGIPYRVGRSRARCLGGSAYLWDTEISRGTLGARFRPLDPEDFETRDWVPNSGWPFGWNVMEPYYRAIHELFGVGPWHFHDTWSELGRESRLMPSFRPAVFQAAPSKPFIKGLWSTIAAERNCRVLYNAPVVGLKTDGEHARVEEVEILAPGWKRSTVRAKVFVVAAGGIETARLLLLSGHGRGIGNDYDLVGRYFMEHPHITSGVLCTTTGVSEVFETIGFRDHGGARIEVRYALDPDTARQKGVGHISVGFRSSGRDLLKMARRSKPVPARWSGALMLHAIRRRLPPPDLVAHVKTILRGLPSLLVEREPLTPEGLDSENLVGLVVMSEQVPNPISRVLLGRRRDSLGLPVARLDWRLSSVDVRTLQTAQRLLLEELTPRGFSAIHDSVMQLDPRVPSGRHYGGGYHHMGTTRMHASPRQGVVDPHCLVHGTSNLFVAGSGVFPTSGYANPTMTILALSLRLVEHLECQLRGLRAGEAHPPP